MEISKSTFDLRWRLQFTLTFLLYLSRQNFSFTRVINHKTFTIEARLYISRPTVEYLSYIYKKPIFMVT